MQHIQGHYRELARSILGGARDLIESRQESYVCFAIQIAACGDIWRTELQRNRWITSAEQASLQRVADLLVEEIEQRLGLYFTVHSWLAGTSPEFCSWYNQIREDDVDVSAKVEEQLRLYRLRWIDSMLQELA